MLGGDVTEMAGDCGDTVDPRVFEAIAATLGDMATPVSVPMAIVTWGPLAVLDGEKAFPAVARSMTLEVATYAEDEDAANTPAAAPNTIIKITTRAAWRRSALDTKFSLTSSRGMDSKALT
ncbi:MAG: hypothetical protein ABI438_00655 [Dermatophilaceae bacterium]